MGKRKQDQPTASAPAFRLDAKVVAQWLARHGLTVEQIAAGDPLTAEDVEAEIAREDPVAFAALRLREESDLVGDDGLVWCRTGDPWRLTPVQETMSRFRTDIILECGAEVGKTRDVVLQALWAADSRPGVKVLIIGNRELTTKAIFRALVSQLRLSFELGGWRIGGGLENKPSFSDFLFSFRNGASIELRICGTDGENILNAHVDLVLFDEAAMAKDPLIFDRVFRALKVGPENFFRIYSTPDGDYSGAFWGICNRATPVDGRTFEERKADTARIESERGFSKFNITKDQFPPPFMTPERRKKLIGQYGGENSIGFQTQFLGRWGSPSYSVFPMTSLKPNLRRDLDRYRLVVVAFDKADARYRLRASRLGKEEEILADETMPFLGGEDLGRAIVRFFPEIGATDLAAGVDLGSATDPSEFLFNSADGSTWTDEFRLHLRGIDWTVQERVVTFLDHAGGHRARWALDRGGPGAGVVAHLQNSPDYATCPVCRESVAFSERLIGINFADGVDEVDPDTGDVVLGDKRNAAGERMPVRLSSKELATRILERKMQRAELRIADDRGAGDPSLAAQTLLVNHTSTGVTSRGERKFRGVDDHAVDARRFAALSIAFSRARGIGLTADRAVSLGLVGSGSARDADFSMGLGVGRGFAGEFGGGGVVSGLMGGW